VFELLFQDEMRKSTKCVISVTNLMIEVLRETSRIKKCCAADSTALLGNLSSDLKRSPCSECCIFLLGDSPAYKFRGQRITQEKEYNLRFISSHEDGS